MTEITPVRPAAPKVESEVAALCNECGETRTAKSRYFPSARPPEGNCGRRLRCAQCDRATLHLPIRGSAEADDRELANHARVSAELANEVMKSQTFYREIRATDWLIEIVDRPISEEFFPSATVAFIGLDVWRRDPDWALAHALYLIECHQLSPGGAVEKSLCAEARDYAKMRLGRGPNPPNV